MSIVSEKQVESALAFLAESDLNYAHLKANMLRTEYMIDVAEAMAFRAQGEGSVELKKMNVKIDTAVQTAQEKYLQAVIDYEALRAKRKRAELMIDVWRSVFSARKQGVNV